MRVLYFTEGDSPHDQRFLRSLAETSHQVFVLRQKFSIAETPLGLLPSTGLTGNRIGPIGQGGKMVNSSLPTLLNTSNLIWFMLGQCKGRRS